MRVVGIRKVGPEEYKVEGPSADYYTSDPEDAASTAIYMIEESRLGVPAVLSGAKYTQDMVARYRPGFVASMGVSNVKGVSGGSKAGDDREMLWRRQGENADAADD